MAIKLVEIKCPNCGATLNYEEGRKVLYCQYCGEKILIDDDHEYTYHHIDDADIKRAETDQMVKMRWLEMEERERRRYFRAAVGLCIICAALVIIGVIGMSVDNAGMGIGGLFAIIIGILGWDYLSESNKKNMADISKNLGRIKIGKSSSDFEGKDYRDVEKSIRSYGFTNISMDAMGDLTFGLIYKPGRVDTITIDGNRFSNDDWFSPDAHVVISYHSKSV